MQQSGVLLLAAAVAAFFISIQLKVKLHPLVAIRQ
jgi:hypothetical protein